MRLSDLSQADQKWLKKMTPAELDGIRRESRRLIKRNKQVIAKMQEAIVVMNNEIQINAELIPIYSRLLKEHDRKALRELGAI